MATTYSIYFENNYGETQNYGFFSAPPTVTGNVGSPKAYSNIWLSQSLANGGNWQIDVTKTYYAWCGKISVPLAPGVSVTTGNGKLATLGSSTSSGSTWKMYNNGGSPAFDQVQTFEAPASAFQIRTGTDFLADQHFLLGLGTVDQNGRMKPAATMEAPRNATVSIAPVTVYYLASFDSAVGAVIDTSIYSTDIATIDFTKNRNMFGAVVKQDEFGKFDVKYHSSPASFEKAIAASRAGSAAGSQSNQLRKLIQEMQSVLNNAEVTNPNSIWKCKVTYRNDPTRDQALAIYKALQASMLKFEYVYFTNYQAWPVDLEILFKDPHDRSRGATANLWNISYNNLPLDLKTLCLDAGVTEDPNQNKAIENGTNGDTKAA